MQKNFISIWTNKDVFGKKRVISADFVCGERKKIIKEVLSWAKKGKKKNPYSASGEKFREHLTLPQFEFAAVPFDIFKRWLMDGYKKAVFFLSEVMIALL